MSEPQQRVSTPRAFGPGREQIVYYALIGLYFFAFGLQIVIYPALATFSLGAGGAGVGAAQMALSGPMFVFLLFGGLLAERSRAGPALALLQLGFALPPLWLAGAIAANQLGFSLLIGYGLVMGTLAAFMLPVRDAALNGVVQRGRAKGRTVLIATAATTATAVQIGAQILGITFAGQLLERIGAAPLLIVQAAVVAIGAALALQLEAPRPVVTAKRTLADAFSEIGAGLAYAVRDPVMGPMLASAAFVGIFVIGSFQVLFPLIVRESYGGGADELGALYVCFWAASFVAAVILGRIGPLERPGRALLLCHLIGAAMLATFAVDKPLWAFAALAAAWGLAGGVSIATSRTITQSAAAPEFLGRVLAAYSMGFFGGAPIGSAAIGIAADAFGPRTAALVPAVGFALAAGALAAFTPLWRLRRSDLRPTAGG